MPPGFAPAKVNLTLHVTGRRPDGYHLLDSLVAFADVGDMLIAETGDDLRVTGPFAEGVPTDAGNLIVRALRLAGTTRAVNLDKQLPHPAGLGGGSSDAAAVLRLVGVAPSTADLLTLGADVPVCMAARAARMRGVGETIMPVSMPTLPAVLVNPGLTASTPKVFAALRTADAPGMGALPAWRDGSDAIAWLKTMRNDLAAPAVQVAPGIAGVLEAIAATGAGVARMSGSGATCFGLYASGVAARKAAEALARTGWWVRPCLLS